MLCSLHHLRKGFEVSGRLFFGFIGTQDMVGNYKIYRDFEQLHHGIHSGEGRADQARCWRSLRRFQRQNDANVLLCYKNNIFAQKKQQEEEIRR